MRFQVHVRAAELNPCGADVSGRGIPRGANTAVQDGVEGSGVVTAVGSGVAVGDEVFSMIGKALKLTAFHVFFDLLKQPDRMKAADDHLFVGAEKGQYKSTIDETFSLKQVAEANRRLASNEQFGKVVVQVSDR